MVTRSCSLQPYYLRVAHIRDKRQLVRVLAEYDGTRGAAGPPDHLRDEKPELAVPENGDAVPRRHQSLLNNSARRRQRLHEHCLHSARHTRWGERVGQCSGRCGVRGRGRRLKRAGEHLLVVQGVGDRVQVGHRESQVLSHRAVLAENAQHRARRAVITAAVVVQLADVTRAARAVDVAADSRPLQLLASGALDVNNLAHEFVPENSGEAHIALRGTASCKESCQ